MKKTTSGFTIIELLIVIVIIAILAAIAIVAYNGITEKSRQSVLQGDLSGAKKKLQLYQVDNGHFPTTTAELISAGVSATKSVYDTTGNNLYYCYNKLTDQFGLGARTANGKKAYIITSNTGITYVASGIGADQVCQALGLTGYLDTNSMNTVGYSSGSGWISWVNG